MTLSLQTLLEPWFLFLADDPTLRLLQMGMLLLGTIVIFLVFFVTRDILLRTDSFLYMFLCIILVAFLPVVGFFLYLLIRPARTIKEREVEKMLRSLLQKNKIGWEKEKKEQKKN
ncbi:MAG TPA: hypothetical protein VJB10_03045 [Candidatus Peribacteraceae bacterium]|nr:hypothetical protein [Candidatus Peribacteraceae bacterium]